MMEYIKSVIASWQVIAVTLVLIVYFFLVSYVARLYHPRRNRSFSFTSRPKKEKTVKAAEIIPESSDDDLDLE